MEVLQKLGQLSENTRVMNKPFTIQALMVESEGFSVTKFRQMAKTICC